MKQNVRTTALEKTVDRASIGFDDCASYLPQTVNALPDLVYVLNPDGRFLYWNRSLTDRTGYNDDEVASMSSLDFFPETEKQPIADAIATAWATGKATIEACILTKDGDCVPYEFSSSVLHDERGNAVALCGAGRDLTERNEIESALRESEQRFRTLFESSRDAMMVLGEDGHFVAGNHAAVEIFGCKNEQDFTERTPADLSPMRQPDGRPSSEAARKMIDEAMNDGSCFFEWLHRRADGTEFEASVLLTRMELGGQAQLHATVRDISAEKRLRESLKRHAADLTERVKELRCLQQASAIFEERDLPPREMIRRVVRLLPASWRFASSAAARITFHQEEFPTDGFRETAICQRAPFTVDGVGVGSIDVCYLDDSSAYPVEPFLAEERALLDQIAGRLGRAIERFESYQRIKTLHQELELILASTKTRLLLVDQSCKVRYADPETQRLYGKLTNQTCRRYLFLAPEQCPSCHKSRSLKPERTVLSHFTLPLEPDRVFQRTSVPISAPGGEPMVATVFVDVTEHKELETRLNQARKLEAVGQLAAGIAHEINTPAQFVGDNIRFLRDALHDLEEVLTKLDGLLASAGQDAAGSDALSDLRTTCERVELGYLRREMPLSIEQTFEGVNQIAAIVRAIKEFSHPGDSARQSVDINHAIESTLTVASGEWKHVAELVTNLEPDLPPVSCFPAELNQAVLNILVNAAQAIAETPRERGTITVSTCREQDSVVVRISDTGPGIPGRIQSKIFDPFFTTKEVGKGTGQGLAIAHAVVEKHGGTVDFETEPEKGTTFILRLPLDPNEANDAGNQEAGARNELQRSPGG